MRLTNIQAARFFCALAILLSHLSLFSRRLFFHESRILNRIETYLTGPALFIFFAISGFVLMHSLSSTPPRQFLLARLLRVFPPYWCAAIGYHLISTALNGYLTAGPGQLAAGISLLPFGRDAIFHPLGVEWSLVFEVAFYSVLGLSFLVVPTRFMRAVVGLWLAFVLFGLFSVRGPYQPYPRWGELLLSPITLPFLGGALAAPLTRFPRTLRAIAPIVVPTLFAIATTIPRWEWSILCSAAACTLLVAWLAVGRQLEPNHLLVRFGDCSYGIYLAHVPLINLGFFLWLRTQVVFPPLSFIMLVGLLALAGGLAYGHYEAAVYRRLKRRLFPRKPAPVLDSPLRSAA